MDIRDKIDIFLYSAGCNQHSSTYSSTEYHFVLYNAYIKHEEFYYRKLWMGPDGEFLKKSGQCHLWSFKERSPFCRQKMLGFVAIVQLYFLTNLRFSVRASRGLQRQKCSKQNSAPC